MTIWYNSVIKSNIAGYNCRTGLLLHAFKFHRDSFTSLLEEKTVRIYKIPPHYTALLLFCGAGINKLLKDRLKQCSWKWRR